MLAPHATGDTMQPHEILDALHDSEINCRIECFFDSGWTAWLGDEMNGFRIAPVPAPNFAACVIELAEQACAIYPKSKFAEYYRTTK